MLLVRTTIYTYCYLSDGKHVWTASWERFGRFSIQSQRDLRHWMQCCQMGRSVIMMCADICCCWLTSFVPACVSNGGGSRVIWVSLIFLVMRLILICCDRWHQPSACIYVGMHTSELEPIESDRLKTKMFSWLCGHTMSSCILHLSACSINKSNSNSYCCCLVLLCWLYWFTITFVYFVAAAVITLLSFSLSPSLPLAVIIVVVTLSVLSLLLPLLPLLEKMLLGRRKALAAASQQQLHKHAPVVAWLTPPLPAHHIICNSNILLLLSVHLFLFMCVYT